MKSFAAICTAFLLTGCIATIPVSRNFPDIPPSLQAGCENLELVPEGTDKLSEVLVVVTNNYSKYHECQIKVETWQEWYKTQKEIFDSVR
jgi:hypothetical protein